MYNDYFGFKEKPFSITPDPRYFYTNPTYQEAYANLIYAIRERRGLIMLTGEVGTGKTTILRRLMENAESNVRFVFFYNPVSTFQEFWNFIGNELGISSRETSRLHQLEVLKAFLLDEMARGNTVVLLIDEAQNLNDDVLEDIRLLSNLETSSEKLLQISLVGQPEIEVRLEQPRLRQLKQRIAVRCHLSRLADDEVESFINYRLNIAGYKRQQLFAPEAIKEIAFYSKGYPRLINILCDNALLIAYATSRKKITADIVREAASDLRLTPPGAQETLAEPRTSQAAVAPATRRRAIGATSVPQTMRGRRLGRAHRGIKVVVVLLLLAGGTAFYGWRANASLLGNLKHGLAVLQHSLQRTHSGRGAKLQEEGSNVHSANKPSIAPSMPSAVDTLNPSSSPTVSSKEHRQAVPAADDAAASGAHLAETAAGGQQMAASTTAELPAWKQTPMVVQPGSTIAEIAASVYGANRLLGLDLIKEFNTHIDNLNWVLAGQKLWIPPLSRETLVRPHANGSYNLILGSFRSLQQAEQFAYPVRRQGFEVVVTPRKISDSLLLYRVEIGGLKDLQAVETVWEMALTQQWIVVADHPARRRF
jgi:general secretion pathway protein A